MKKVINLLLIITSLLGYLEWGTNNHSFLFQVEKEIILKLFSNPKDIIHPFVILPLIGQFLLMFTLFQKNVNKKVSFIGASLLAILLLFLFVIGLIGFNYKIIFSCIPFIFSLFAFVIFNKKDKTVL